MYCSPCDLRAAGFGADQFPDDRLPALCERATRYIDMVTGRWFEPRGMTIRIDGNGGKALPLPHFLIEAGSVRLGGVPVAEYVLYNRMEDRDYPKLYAERGWPKGALNVEIAGLWGYVDAAGGGAYVTPPMIARAAMKLISLTGAAGLGDTAAISDASERGRVVKETTDGHSYEMKAASSASGGSGVVASYTGDQEIDQILDMYAARSMGLGLI
ncbi:MAG: hypothetical protein LBL73_09745 [Synergistaceae bacterium]|jgi:hypothetical protein|nr:hypothetical protein [Synergistaceae bacterium]